MIAHDVVQLFSQCPDIMTVKEFIEKAMVRIRKTVPMSDKDESELTKALLQHYKGPNTIRGLLTLTAAFAPALTIDKINVSMFSGKGTQNLSVCVNHMRNGVSFDVNVPLNVVGVAVLLICFMKLETS